MKKIICILLIFLLLIPIKYVYGAESEIMPSAYHETEIEDIKTIISNTVDTYGYRYFVFDDLYGDSWIVCGCRYQNFDNATFTDYNFTYGSSFTQYYVYSINKTDIVATTKFFGNRSGLNLYDILGYSICNRSSFLFCNDDDYNSILNVDIKSQYTPPTCATYDEMYETQQIIINPNNNYDTKSNTITPFYVKIYDEETSEIAKFNLDINSDFWNAEKLRFEISSSVLSYYLENNCKYAFHLYLYDDADNFVYSEEMFDFTYNNNSIIFDSGNNDNLGDNEEDTSTNQIVGSIGSMSNQITSGLNEVNETNKGMWESIKEVLSYINPFSENFFVYKLIELLLDMLKSLFIPSEDFFTNWLDDLNSYFGDTFGILYFPMELFIDFLNRIDTIDSTNPIINVPEFKLEFMGYSATFIKSFSYDFNSLLVNDTFKTIHTIYLSIVDVILWLTVVYTASKCIKNILGGMSDEILDNATSSERSYKQYEKYMNNKKRYKNEHRE